MVDNFYYFMQNNKILVKLICQKCVLSDIQCIKLCNNIWMYSLYNVDQNIDSDAESIKKMLG